VLDIVIGDERLEALAIEKEGNFWKKVAERLHNLGKE
jgi:ribosomal protein L18E